MRVTLLGVVVALTALTIHCSAAADPECLYRQIRNLPMHWSNPTDCGRFYRCSNKNVKREVICAADKEYNPKTGKCASTGKGYCKLSFAEPLAGEDNACAAIPSGAYVPQENKCRDFYICNDNVAYPQSCDPGSSFNAATAACEPDKKSKCWQNFCLTQSNGVFLADRASCRSFYICDANNAVLQSCDAGSYFNSTEMNCQPDVNNDICWENFCLKAADGVVVKNPTNCHGYYSCKSQTATPVECPEGEYFDWTSNECQVGECPSVETTTTTSDCPETTTALPPSCETCTCPGGYKEGQLLKYPGNCQYFYICAGGVLVQQSCREGNYFDDNLEACTVDVDGVCPECKRQNYRRSKRSLDEDETHPTQAQGEGEGVGVGEEEVDMAEEKSDENRETDVESEKQPADQPTCMGLYFENQMIAHDACNKYQICVNGELHTGECGSGSYYNDELKACIRDEHNICNISNEPNDDVVPETVHEEIVPVSAQHESVEETIPETHASSSSSSSSCCAEDTSGCTCPGGYQPDEILPHPTDCDKFYICLNGQLVLHECGQGNTFDRKDTICLPDTNHTCWPENPGCGGGNEPDPDMCVGKQNGLLLPNRNNCTQFYQCVNNVPKAGSCGPGEWFNPARGSCEVDINAVCVSPCSGTTGIKFLPHPDCTKFYFCNNGQGHVESCNEGGFNTIFGVCTLNATCEASMCAKKPDGTTFPVAGDKSKFYLCISNVATIQDCLPYTEYDEHFEVCLDSPSANCDQQKCANEATIVSAFPTAGNSEDSFCFCRNGAAYETGCPAEYVFNKKLGICYSNAPCDPDLCTNKNEYSVSMNRNDSHSFCLCVMDTPVIVDCPDNATFYPNVALCRGNVPQDPLCNPTFCLDQPDYTTDSAPNTNTGFCFCKNGGATYHNCTDKTFFNPTMGICLPSTFYCDINKCADGANTVFEATNDPYAFCYCQSTTEVEFKSCPENSMFSPSQLVCLQSPCDSKQCLGAAYQTKPFPANEFDYGYCTCEGPGKAVFTPCPSEEVFDPTQGACISEASTKCEYQLCHVPGKPYPYDIPAVNDPYSFCYCVNDKTVQIFHCPLGKVYKPQYGACMDETTTPPECDSCTCPGGYPAGSLLPHPQYCSEYYACTNGVLQLRNCGTGNFFNVSLGVCQPDVTRSCTDNPSPCTCVGAYQEGEMIAHPTNSNMYYLCQNSLLQQKSCNTGYYFDAQQSACVAQSNMYWYHQKSRSVPDDIVPQEVITSNDSITEDFPCRSNAKRSVPSNCSQFEVCQNGQWQRHTCSSHRYYNPEERKCLEPRDDTICNYAKVSGLPACSDQTEHQTLPHKNVSSCGQYFRCIRGKWRLKACGRREYYSRHMRTCVPTQLANICEARNVSETAAYATTMGELSKPRCRHTAVRPFLGNCAKYLMCLEGEWWHQYCPLGMYFNRTLNYCMPNDDGQCDEVTNVSENEPNPEPEFAEQNCTRDGELRPSAMACDKYYVCISGQWLQQTCGKAGLYYNVTSEACVADIDGVCEQLLQDGECQNGDRREFPLNCTSFEVCEDGTWHRRSCGNNWTYDVLVRECVPNTNGQCSANGLRRSCHIGELRSWPIVDNCAQFLYCETDSWLPVTCLKGHTFAADLRTCVPHVPNNPCTPMWHDSANLTVLSIGANGTDSYVEGREDFEMELTGSANSCSKREDGASVPHPTDCTRFYLCLNELPGPEQQCAVGSFFDTSYGYCRPNDGSCIAPMAGPCKNASNGAILPNLDDCRTYYRCSTLNGSQIINCPDGQYFHRQSKQCRIDNGECQKQSPEKKCTAQSEHGRRIPHEHYCNIYYACVRGLAIPIECPSDYQFNAVLGRCLKDSKEECVNGELINGNESTYSCGNLTDGTYLPNRYDCTRYFICSNGNAQPKRCAAGAYFDSQQLLCVPDDGSCPLVDDEPSYKPIPPDPTTCEGKHGNMMPDPANCNEFYVCINSKLRHERCFTDYFFNVTINQCQTRDKGNDNNATTTTTMTTEATIVTETTEPTPTPTPTPTLKVSNMSVGSPQQKCVDKPTNLSEICTQIAEGASLAEQGDCRRFISCQDKEPISQRCRNGESYDSLLGFCRQNDGTCLLENGQRVGECNKRHGQLARDAENCRGYFVCINGQKIPGECAENEYFDRATNTCRYDVLKQCSTSPKKASTDDAAVSCQGLSEAVLYPYIYDHCRSYFQCVKGSPKIHECADGLYFDASSTRCVKEIQECSMPASITSQNLLRAPETTTDISPKHRCEDAIIGKPYANIDDHCRSYYVCEDPETIAYETCPQGTLYSTEKRGCAAAEHTICRI